VHARLKQRGNVRERYVLQVLLVTLGFGLLLGVFAIVATPDDQSQPICDHPMAKPDEAALCVADLKDDCSLRFRAHADKTETPAKQDCEKMDASLRGLRSE
jgi:hypothetical protein